MKVIVNENVANPTELETNAETSPGEELELLEPLLANETSTDVEANIIDPQITEFQQEATHISLSPNIVVTTINEMEMTETTAKTEANYDTKGICHIITVNLITILAPPSLALDYMPFLNSNSKFGPTPKPGSDIHFQN